jgi:hypothetical protein
VVIARGGTQAARESIEIDVTWAGLRARVQVAGYAAGWAADIRRSAGDATTSVAGGSRPLDDDGKVALPIEDDDLIGQEAVAVVLDDEGTLRAQQVVTVGGED